MGAVVVQAPARVVPVEQLVFGDRVDLGYGLGVRTVFEVRPGGCELVGGGRQVRVGWCEVGSNGWRHANGFAPGELVRVLVEVGGWREVLVPAADGVAGWSGGYGVWVLPVVGPGVCRGVLKADERGRVYGCAVPVGELSRSVSWSPWAEIVRLEGEGLVSGVDRGPGTFGHVDYFAVGVA